MQIRINIAWKQFLPTAIKPQLNPAFSWENLLNLKYEFKVSNMSQFYYAGDCHKHVSMQFIFYAMEPLLMYGSLVCGISYQYIERLLKTDYTKNSEY